MPPKLQEGIYYGSGAQPDKFWAMLFLRAARDCPIGKIRGAIGELWLLYQGLKQGRVPDLPDHPMSPGNLTVLLAYGPNVFALPGLSQTLPADLRSVNWFRSPLPDGGGPLLIGSGLNYATDVKSNVATEEFAVQFIAATQLAVNRCLVETWKHLTDSRDPATGQAVLMITGFFTGFQRDDSRSWLDFHDGISNLRSQDRLSVIGIKPSGVPADNWTEGGTYLAFLRVAVDLAEWRKLTVEQQEAFVGRSKLTGCPLTSHPAQPAGGCPLAGTREVIDPGNENFREPSIESGPLAQSHVQRANHHQGPVSDRNSLRIFRQGYEFLETLEHPPLFRTGLNFVSFQDTPSRLLRMLTQNGWLGNVNFGGAECPSGTGMDHFLTIRAGGVFLVPPVVDRELFPGASIFPA